jgi:hypothetical protein
MKVKALGINFCSVMGYDVHNVGNIDITLSNLKKATSSKIISILFKGEFENTLQRIATNEFYIDYIKTNLEELFNLISDQKLSHIVSQILKMFVKYNKDLGDWIILKLLNIDCENRQVSLLYDLIKSNPKEFLGRLKIIKDFIFDYCDQLSSKENPSVKEIEKLEPFMNTFIDLVDIYSKNLKIDQWCKPVLTEEELTQRSNLPIQKFIGIIYYLIPI